jgi:hypothetical protein
MENDLIALKIFNFSEIEKYILKYTDTAKNIQQICLGSKFSRTGIKYAIQSLYTRGFIKKIKYGKRFLYISLTKQELAKKFREISELIISAPIVKGARIKVSHDNEFIVHVGKEEILPAYSRIASVNKKERIKAIQHHKSWLDLINKITQHELINFNSNIIKNKIILEGMLNESAYTSYLKEIKDNPEKNKAAVESLSGRMADYAVFPDNFFNYSSEIWLFKSTALLIDWSTEVAIEITNEHMAYFLRDMFEFVKRGCRKIDHNKAIKEIAKEII